MELIQCTPWIRFADNLLFTRQRGPSRTYDCRMLYTRKGEATLELAENTYPLRHGCAVIFQPGCQYCIRPTDSITLTVLDFDYTQDYSSRVAFLPPCPTREFCPERAHMPVFFSDAPELNAPLFMEQAFFLEPVLQSIVSEFRNKHSFFQGKASTLFKDALFGVVRAHRGIRDSQSIINQLQHYIDSHLSDHITNHALGEIMGYNPNYLNRMVLELTGMSLHQYVLQRRLTNAAERLINTQQPISEIAISLGFHSASHFSGFFKKATGLSPAQYRKNGAL